MICEFEWCEVGKNKKMALSKIFNEIILETALAELFDFNKIVPYDFQQIGNLKLNLIIVIRLKLFGSVS